MKADAGTIVLCLAMGALEAECFSRIGDEIADAVVGLYAKLAAVINDLDLLPVKGAPVRHENDTLGRLPSSIDPDLLIHARLLY